MARPRERGAVMPRGPLFCSRPKALLTSLPKALVATLMPALLAYIAIAPGTLHAADLTVLEEGSSAHFTGLGNEALMEGRYEIAVSLYSKALAQDDDYITARFNMGLAWQRLGDVGKARAAYEAVLAKQGNHSPSLANLAWLEWQLRDYDAAAVHYSEASRHAATRPREQADYLYALGAVRDAQGRSLDARRAYEQALAADPQHVAAHFNLGTLMLGPLAGTPSALAVARENLEQAVALESGRVDAWLNLSLCREQQGDAPGAETALDRAVAVAAGDDLPRALWRRARWYERQVPARRIAMRTDLEACLAQAPDFPDANGKLGAYLFAIGDYDRAIIHLDREVAEANDQRTPADLEAHFLLAEIYSEHRPDAGKALLHAAAAHQTDEDPRLRELHRRVDRLLEPRTPTDSPPSPKDS